MNTIHNAIIKLRKRTGDKAYGVRVKAGFAQVVRVTFDENGVSTVIPQSPWHAVGETVERIENLIAEVA